tara:strand:- start:450 stop:743 length:294 start_codon:yes stop_codon:yes gene_type:complete
MNPDDIQDNDPCFEDYEREKYEEHYEDENSPYQWQVNRPFAPAWSRYIVRTVEGEAESEKIFYAESAAQTYCERKLGEGRCAYVVEVPGEDSDDIPF